MADTLTGTLHLRSAAIDWRDETARCVGVFRSDEAAALEVEYRVHLDAALLDLLARAFLQAGVPILRESKAAFPGVVLRGDTPAEYVAKPRQRRPAVGPDGEKIDRRTRAWREMQKAPAAAPTNGDTP